MDKQKLISKMSDIQTNYDCGFITIEEYIAQNKVVIDLYYVNSPNALPLYGSLDESSSVNTITQKELQIIFDNNGLDSYCVYSIGLNHVDNGDVVIDNDLYEYMSPFSFLINHLY
tara:strand:- start:2309 stop:2653 length:345 start_codon:yes stop_codon:yes gene_type:complete